MKRIARFIGRLPLAGKVLIRPLVFEFYRATTPKKRRSIYFGLTALLGWFIFLHAVQAWAEIKAMGFKAPTWFMAIAGLYVLVNLAVVLTQIHLVCRTTRFLLRGPRPRGGREYAEYSWGESATMFTVTVCGQAAFIVPWAWYS